MTLANKYGPAVSVARSGWPQTEGPEDSKASSNEPGACSPLAMAGPCQRCSLVVTPSTSFLLRRRRVAGMFHGFPARPCKSEQSSAGVFHGPCPWQCIRAIAAEA